MAFFYEVINSVTSFTNAVNSESGKGGKMRQMPGRQKGEIIGKDDSQ